MTDSPLGAGKASRGPENYPEPEGVVDADLEAEAVAERSNKGPADLSDAGEAPADLDAEAQALQNNMGPNDLEDVHGQRQAGADAAARAEQDNIGPNH